MTAATPYALYLSRLSATSQRSIHSQMRSIGKLMDWHSSELELKLSAIDYQQAMQLRALMVHAGWSARSINRAMTAIRNIVKVAALMGKADVSQVAHIETIGQMKHGQHQGNPLTNEQVTALFTRLKEQKTDYGKRTFAIFALFLGTGLRRSELAALKLSELDLEKQTLTVLAGKGNKSRILFLPAWVVQALVTWLKVRGQQQGYLICKCSLTGIKRTGTAVSPDTLYRIVRETLSELGIPGVSPHDLRRTFITRLLSQRVDINTVRQMAGHADISTTTLYDKRSDDFMRQAAARLNFDAPPTRKRRRQT
ncbi:tyrosine-type recombinase/integrase [Shewanella algae]|uniref:tyrosine-type recombinase/integrase n=1 Tax=Shewanella algae TaxID=38313 RepID=UPI0031F5307A